MKLVELGGNHRRVRLRCGKCRVRVVSELFGSSPIKTPLFSPGIHLSLCMRARVVFLNFNHGDGGMKLQEISGGGEAVAGGM